MTELTQFSLINNAISGTLVSQLGLLTKLTTLQVRMNDITGSVPSEIGEDGTCKKVLKPVTAGL